METSMANLMRTSNPAFNEKAFKGQVAFGDAAGHRQQDGIPPALRRGHRRMDLGLVALSGSGSGRSMDDGRRFRWLYRRGGYDFQSELGAVHRTHLRAPRRP